MPLLFGTAGVPLSATDRSSQGGIRKIQELGLGALELEFVQGVRMGEEKAGQIKQLSEDTGIRLSCHGPYWINFNSREAEKVAASRERLLHTARVARMAGIEAVVFHPAFYHGDSPEIVFKRIVQELSSVREALTAEGNSVLLRPETTGKPSQYGDLEETVHLAQTIPGVLPCIDFSHLHARSNGRLNSYDEFSRILDFTAEALGDSWVKRAHFHISGIEYGLKGEKRHLVLRNSDFNYRELMRALRVFGVEGLAICESPNLEEDALQLQAAYRDAGGVSHDEL
ncbi:TIM barrel protein [Acididesulfobacillus acetoxydans]|uniref:TIM barrel protein n=1 Tax=Acididesulfobacillus acetoxydans TaxID=1561005 RepID=UPI001F0F0304|nr:TIM barrel protein [Acididesulfobacillus acetoxydans]